MKAYRIAIKQPLQIPAVVYETRKRAAEKPLWVLLEHQEQPNVVRGMSQPFEKHRGVVEIKRPDGGLSWYHPGTYCLILGEKTDKFYDHKAIQQEWGDKVKGLLHLHGHNPSLLKYDNSDILYVNGSAKHLIGMSGWIGKEKDRPAIEKEKPIKIQRACWYEQSPIQDISDMLRADGISPSAFEKRLALVNKGFFTYLAGLFKAQEVSADMFISDESWICARELQKRKSGSYRGSCVMGASQNI
jgi:hypothetical protein